MENENYFNYTYSATQQEEIESIRKKYIFEEKKVENKMEELRRLDRSATKKGEVFSITLGIVSTLIMGLGMTCILEWSDKLFIPGIFIGLAGIVGVVGAYPLYLHLTNLERKKIAPQILKLTNELSGK